MSLLRIDGLCLSHGPKVLFENATLTVAPRERIGLIGANGTGKSTLLKIIAGRVKPDAGTLTFRRRTQVGFLTQDLIDIPPLPLTQAVLSAVPGRDALENKVADLQSALASETDVDVQMELAQGLADAVEAQTHFDARHGPHRAEGILLGLGFSRADFSRNTDEFSGGWRMRAALASLLLQAPDLLLLDEPTNHLDLPTLAWFESFLKRSSQAIMVVSHDRDFLNRHIDRVVSLEVEGVKSYVGNYHDYLAQREAELTQLEALAARQASRRAEIEAFIQRFRAKASKARQVQSRIKQLARAENVQTVQARATVDFAFPESAPSGREVLWCKKVDKRFGDKVIYRGLEAQILRGERIAVVGLNGTGKSTLLKMIAGELVPDGGEIQFGHQVQMGYFAQHHGDTLSAKDSVFSAAQAWAPERTPLEVRSALGAFLFSGDDVDKPIGVLSGGERARVALARLLLQPANFLVMDEPTNHLDLDSSEALIDALEQYAGTLLFVSHNRSFLNRLATKVWDVRDGTVVTWPGNLDDYLKHLELHHADNDGDRTDAEGPKKGEGTAPRSKKQHEALVRQEKSRKRTPLRKALAEVEQRIATLEQLQADRTLQMADPDFYNDFSKARPVAEATAKDSAALEALYAQWEVLQKDIDALGD